MVLLTLIVLTSGLVVANTASLGVVHTRYGYVQGKSRKTGLSSSVDIFKGIPFAAPPGRFEKPKPHPGWNGTLEAYDYSKRCFQIMLSQVGTRGSEDCLYLDLWVPQSGSQVSKNLPVMVWIYGGAFLFGSGKGPNLLNNYLYDGEEIASRGKVIVVNFNYRLGPLGFLSTNDINAPGNYGLWDQHMALTWVKENIAAFGGDPDNICIFGESAGGASVHLQMLSPHSKGLFKRVISQSGSALNPWLLQTTPRHWAEEVAKSVGCPTEDSAALINCLRISDPNAIVMAIKLKIPSSTGAVLDSMVWGAVVDGDFLPDEPQNLFHLSAGIDLISGINNMDGHLFAGMDVPSINMGFGTNGRDLRRVLKAFTKDKGRKVMQDAFDLYSNSWGGLETQEEAARAVVDLETDVMFLVPNQISLELHERACRNGTSKTYAFVFSHPSRLFLYPDWMGAEHADDLQFVFGKPFVTPLGYRPQDRDVSTYFINYWTNFARTGDPNNGENAVPANWYPFDTDYRYYLDINHDMNYDSMKQNLRLEFTKFWANAFSTNGNCTLSKDLKTFGP